MKSKTLNKWKQKHTARPDKLKDEWEKVREESQTYSVGMREQEKRALRRRAAKVSQLSLLRRKRSHKSSSICSSR